METKKDSRVYKVSNVRMAIDCLRGCLVVYGYSNLLDCYNNWVSCYEDDIINFDSFKAGINVELSRVFSDLSYMLFDSIGSVYEEKQIREKMKLLSVLL